MHNLFNCKEFKFLMDNIVKDILAGKLFIYPTDTIYGIGCDATNEVAVEKIKKIKERDREKPLSVIAPNTDWIEEHCFIDVEIDKYLPGPYTIILKKKNKNFLSHVSDTDMLGVRIPKCDFSEKVAEAGVPFITTSVNLSGESYAKKIEGIHQRILDKVEVVIDEGELAGKTSILVRVGKEISR